ncbi:MAG: YihY/virulence factor BrkB family protein [Candidatus Omnitrophota bacterium]
MIKRIIHFLKRDIWRIRLKDLPWSKSFLIKQLRIVLLALRGFDENKCQLRASALTFYSLFSIVPVLAMAFGIAKGFGFEKLLETQLLDRFPEHQEVIGQVISFANTLLENTKGGMVAGIGVVLLFGTVIQVLSHIETSFNDIWGVKEARGWGRRFSDYLALMLLCPILVIMSGSITVFIATQITVITEQVSFFGLFAPLITLLLRALPFIAMWVLFTFIYVFMPNTKVKFSSGCLAGIVAGTIYQIVQSGYINFQVGAVRYNAIYGSFAVLPLFLIWLQLSWLIVFLGAEISFAYQNVDTYEFEPDCLNASFAFKKLVALRITHLLVHNFARGEKAWTDTQIAQVLEIPIRLVRQLLFELSASGIVAETDNQQLKQHAYQPAQDPANLTAQFVIAALEKRGEENIPIPHTPELKALSRRLQEFSDLIKNSPLNTSLKEI